MGMACSGSSNSSSTIGFGAFLGPAFVKGAGTSSILHPGSLRSPCSVRIVCQYSPMTVGDESSCVTTPFTPGFFTRTQAPTAKRCRRLAFISLLLYAAFATGASGMIPWPTLKMCRPLGKPGRSQGMSILNCQFAKIREWAQCADTAGRARVRYGFQWEGALVS